MENEKQFVTVTHQQGDDKTMFEVAVAPPKLAKGKRGIVCCPVVIETNRNPNPEPGTITLHIYRRVDPHELRFAALFWDAIDCPTGMMTKESPDVDFLVEAGVAYRSHITHRKENSRTFSMELVAAVDPVAAMLANDTVSPGLWSVQHNPGNEGEGLIKRKESAAIVFNLHSTIPIPDQDVPLAELLEFKFRRSSELKALENYLSEVYLKIISSPFPEIAESVEVARLQGAIADHIRVSRESSMLLRLIGFKAKLDVNTATAAAAAYTTAATLHLAPGLQAVAAAAGGVLGSLSRELGTGASSQTASPFEYVTSVHKEVFAL